MRNGENERDLQSRIVELEKQLANERSRFVLAERAARVGYWRVTLPDFQFSFSAGLLAILDTQITTSVALGNVVSSTPGHDRIQFREKIETAISTRSGFSYNRRIPNAEGQNRDFEILGEPEFDADGDVVAIVGAAHDITERLQAEAERDKAQRLYRIMTEAASDIILIHDTLGKTEFASAALGRVLGWTAYDVGGVRAIELVHPDDRDEIMVLRQTSVPGDRFTATYRMRHANGEYLWFESTVSLVQDEDNDQLRHTVTVLRDVSERKAQDLAIREAFEAAENANRAKSTFLANMSHELRTPLNAIIGFAEVMEQKIFGPVANSRYEEYVGLIHKSGRHLLDLINDVLDMSKIEAGKFTLHLEDVDFSKIIEECSRTMAERAASGNVTLDVSTPSKGLTCPADLRALKQIVLNLLSNAIKFTPPGGHVMISAACPGDKVRIVVSDDGIGIAAEELPRLGRPFEQVCSDSNLAKSGTGLGLALVSALVKQHGGDFGIESTPGLGTTVTVDLPRLARQEEQAA
jgi:PAS domain S-box-containing protein